MFRAPTVLCAIPLAACLQASPPDKGAEGASRVQDTATGAAPDTGCPATAWYTDGDGDGHGAGAAVTACEAPAGTVAQDGDCDDTDDQVFPGATEHCDGVDEDCDGATDEDAVDAASWWEDRDGDGFGGDERRACTRPEHALDADAPRGDCDDTDEQVFPGALERCDTTDQDCDGSLGFDAVVTASDLPLQGLVDTLADGSELCLPAGDWPGPVHLVGRQLHLFGAGSDQSRLRAPIGGRALEIEGESDVVVEDLGLSGASDGTGDALVITEGRVHGRGLAVGQLSGERTEAPVQIAGGVTTLEELHLHDIELAGSPVVEQLGGSLQVHGLDADGLRLQARYRGSLLGVRGGDLELHDSHLHALEASGALLGFSPEASVQLARLRLTDSVIDIDDRGGLIYQLGGALQADALIVAGNHFTGSGSFGARGAAIYTGNTTPSTTTLRNLSWVGNRAEAAWLVEVKFPQTVAVLENCDFSDVGDDPSGRVGGADALVLTHISDPEAERLDFSWNNVQPDVPLFYGGCAGTACDGVTVGPLLGATGQHRDTSAASAADWDLRLVSGSILEDGGDPDCTDIDGSRCDIGAHGGGLASW